MTPQLMQAIKLLQLSNLELASFIEEELERNPLLERAEETADPRDREEPVSEAPDGGDPAERDWASEEFETDRSSLEASLGTELENSFESDATGAVATPNLEGQGLSATSWTGAPPSAEGEGVEPRTLRGGSPFAARPSRRTIAAGGHRSHRPDRRPQLDRCDRRRRLPGRDLGRHRRAARLARSPCRSDPDGDPHLRSDVGSGRDRSRNASRCNSRSGTVSIPPWRRWSDISIFWPGAIMPR